jgi:hypothetical protein
MNYILGVVEILAALFYGWLIVKVADGYKPSKSTIIVSFIISAVSFISYAVNNLS